MRPEIAVLPGRAEVLLFSFGHREDLFMPSSRLTSVSAAPDGHFVVQLPRNLDVSVGSPLSGACLPYTRRAPAGGS
jgi:hypothetical protein